MITLNIMEHTLLPTWQYGITKTRTLQKSKAANAN